MSKHNTHNSIDSEKLAETFVSKLRQITLSKSEAQEMRERLISYTELHAAPASVERKAERAIRSPYFSYFTAYSRVLTASALIILVLVSGTGVSFAAENTLPGQPLYGVKVAIVEPLQGALIANPEAKANWENTLAQRRLTEAATLAAQNNFSTESQTYLAEAVSSHVALAQKEADTLSVSGNQTAALSIRSSLDATLSAHSTLLASVAPHLQSSGDATTSKSVIALLNSVENDRTQVELSRVANEVALGDSADGSATAIQPMITTSPAEKNAISIVNEQNSVRKREEANIFEKNAALFKFLPIATSSASTTASSTVHMNPTSKPYSPRPARMHE